MIARPQTKLRPYQIKLKSDIYSAWGNHKNVLAVAPTGAGKTTIFADLLKEHDGYAAAIVHRKELVAQISLTLAREGVYHTIIGDDKMSKKITNKHIKKYGQSYILPNSKIIVAGVITFVKRAKALDFLYKQITLWVQDEAHHDLAENVWGSAVKLMPNAKGIGVTATPERADGKGLGSHHEGIYDTMVTAPTGRDLIELGYLCDYTIVCDDSVDLEDVPITAGGDFSPVKASKKTAGSTIVGDVVQSYLQHAFGKRGITFAVNVEEATKIAIAFNTWGVKAEVVHAGTDAGVRDDVIERFERGELLMLVNVDLFGEGFDVPMVEVVSMARGTASFGLFAQQFGRALRPVYAEGWPIDTTEQRLAAIANGPKPKAIIIDHVGNVVARHGVPDARSNWTLDRRDSGAKRKVDPNKIMMRKCVNPICNLAYEAYRIACPHCHTQPKPVERKTPKQVDGDLVELSEEVLKRMRGEIKSVDLDIKDAHAKYSRFASSELMLAGMMKNHKNRSSQQKDLRDTMADWGGYQQHFGLNNREIQKRFYQAFEIDVMTAKSLGIKEAVKLKTKIDDVLRILKDDVKRLG
jgi:DNA repair protein RadD